jgi:hypothetical protein
MEQAHDLVEVVDLAFLYKTEPPTTSSAIILLDGAKVTRHALNSYDEEQFHERTQVHNTVYSFVFFIATLLILQVLPPFLIYIRCLRFENCKYSSSYM